MFTPNGLPFFRPFAYRGDLSPAYLVVEQRNIGMISSTPTPWFRADVWDGFLLGKRDLIHDRDPLVTEVVHGPTKVSPTS